jgi:antitoxin component YwqK of YwqJK toxin-antitoxin module
MEPLELENRYNKNGNLLAEYTYLNKLNHGSFKWYYPNKTRSCITQFKKDMEHGPIIKFFY